MNEISKVSVVRSRGKFALVDSVTKESGELPSSVAKCAEIIASTVNRANLATFIANSNTMVLREMSDKLVVISGAIMDAENPTKKALDAICADLQEYLKGLTPKAEG